MTNSGAASNSFASRVWLNETALLISLCIATVVLHLIGARYGFHRDELATLDDARHLAWGYVAYPPITPFFARISLFLLGTSLPGFRFFASVSQAIALLLTSLMARDLGGKIGAQIVAAAAGLPFCMDAGALMQYVSFDYLCWVLSAYFVVRFLKSEDPRWWLAIGGGIGLGMLAKYSIVFFALGIVAGVLLTGTRRHLGSKWLWIGVALSVLIFLPNLIWQVHHHFVSLDFLRQIHERDVRIGRTRDFLPDQLRLTLLAFPLWVAGLYFYLASPQGRAFRMLGWMYMIPLALFVVAKGRGYYLAGAYPMLYAAGAVWGEQWMASLRGGWKLVVWAAASLVLIADTVVATVVAMPMARVNSPRWNFAAERNGDLVEELGWPELTQAVAGIRDSLTSEDLAHLGILAANYGEAGAINLYGPSYRLPNAISGANSFWYRGYGDPPPETLIVLGFSQRFRDHSFSSCTLAGRTPNPYHVQNEETRDHPDIYLCHGLRQSWPDFWKEFQHYG
jgi:hypothetical protein